MKEIPLRVAKCSGTQAMAIFCGILCDVFEDGQFPRGVDGEFDSVDDSYFDEDDETHLRALYRRLDHFMGRDSQTSGDLRRMVIGYAVLCDPENEIVDPEKDYLAPHPSKFTPLIAMHELLKFVGNFTHENLGFPLCICHADPENCVAKKAEALIEKWRPKTDSQSQMADGKESGVVS